MKNLIQKIYNTIVPDEKNLREFLAMDESALEEIRDAAFSAKHGVFGSRIRVFAPLYLSNLCINECTYCGFRLGNTKAKRKLLSEEEISAETQNIVQQGHGNILLVSGEHTGVVNFTYFKKTLDIISKFPEIRRVDLEIGPLPPSELTYLARAGLHTFVVYQETYDRETYKKLHLKGPKMDYDNRREAPAKALKAGFAGAGLGVLLGLSEPASEILSLLSHAREIIERFNIVPSISLPRLRPAEGVLLSEPSHPVDNLLFKKLIACLRLCIPEAEIVLSTREPAELRDELIEFGISALSAGSKTNPGGYSVDLNSTEQFEMADLRTTAEVLEKLELKKLTPFPCAGFRK